MAFVIFPSVTKISRHFKFNKASPIYHILPPSCARQKIASKKRQTNSSNDDFYADSDFLFEN